MVARPRRIAALCALLLAAPVCAAAVPAPASAKAAKSGVFSGRITGALPTGGRGDASVRAYDVRSGALVSVIGTTSGGRFTLRLPAGAYLVDAVSIRDRAVMSERLVPVSLKAGQRRSGVRLHLAAVRAKAAATKALPKGASGKAAASGVTTYRFDDLSGSTKALATLGRGLPSLVGADVLGAETCNATQLPSIRARAVLSSTSQLKRSAYFASSTKVSRALLAPQLAVVGTVSAGKTSKLAAFTIQIVDLSTGTAVDTLKGAVRRSGKGLFTDERRIAAALTERICRAPKTYKVGLAIDARGEYTAYNSTAKLNGTVTAKTTSAEPYTAWNGGASTAWTDNVFRSRVDGCPSSNIKPGTVDWAAKVAAAGGGKAQLTIDLGASEYTGYSKADFTCVNNLANITGAPGPLLTGLAPRTFTLPAGGGTGTIQSTVTLPTGGFIHSGSVTLTPVWSHGLPGAAS